MDKEQKVNNKRLKRLSSQVEFKLFLFLLSLIIFSWPYLSGFINKPVFSLYVFYYFFWALLILIIFLMNFRRIKTEDKKKKDD